MNERHVYLFWTVPCLVAAGIFAWLLVKPVTTDGLVEQAWYLNFVDEYRQVEAVDFRWKTSPPSTTNIQNFWSLAAERPYAYLSNDALDEFTQRYSPAGIDRYVRRARTILLAPCSFEMKRQVLTDPLKMGERLYELITPAFTGSCPVLYVCTFGATKESALENAEATERILETLCDSGAIRSCQGVCSFIASKDKQSKQLSEFIRRIDTFQWYTNFERELETKGLNTGLFAGFLQNMRKLADAETPKLSVSLQQSRLEAIGMNDVINAFFFPYSHGYMCVHRVIPDSPASLRDERKAIGDALEQSYIQALISSSSYVIERYRDFIQSVFLGILSVWGLGMVVIFAVVYIRKTLIRILFGAETRARVKFFKVAPAFSEYFKSLGVKRFDDIINLENTLERFNLKPESLRTHKVINGRASRRIDRIKLPATDTIPENWQSADSCILYVKRAFGRKKFELRKEYVNLRNMEKCGIPATPVVAYGEAIWHGEECALLVTEHLQGYTPLDHWQVFTTPKLSEQERREIVSGLSCRIAAVMQACHANWFYNIQIYSKHIFFKRDDSGSVCICLIDVEQVSQRGKFARLAAYLLPGYIRRSQTRDMVLLNRSLFFSLWPVRERIKLYNRYTGRNSLTRSDKRVLRSVAARSIARGYVQYRAEKSGIRLILEYYHYFAPFDEWHFVDYMSVKDGSRVTKKRDRTVVRFERTDQPYYLKRHFGIRFFSALKLFLKHHRAMSNATMEWDALERIEAIGIPSVPAVAMGERFGMGIRERQSFLLTAELPRGESIESQLGKGVALSTPKRIELARRIGTLARKLHTAGYVHRDFYLGHIYAVGDLNKTYKLHLLDLQRVTPGAALYNRWSIKDITALHFSSKSIDMISNSDRMRVLFAYLGITALDRRSRLFLYRILAKCNRVEKHTDKLLKRRRARGELPACNL